jgi:hypothetical protein
MRLSIHALALAACVLAGTAASTLRAEDVGTAFSYQGRLQQGGTPVLGPVDLVFRLYDAALGGTQQGPTVLFDDYANFGNGGAFVVNLDFGATAFTGEARWIEVSVNGTPLLPRQRVMPNPYSIFGLNGAGDSPWINNGTSISYGGKVGIGITTPLATLHVAQATSGTGVSIPGLRVQESSESPNVIGGAANNNVGGSVVGGTIGGGGRLLGLFDRNYVSANYGTIGGGFGHNIDFEISYFDPSDQGATIAGGIENYASGGGTIGGGKLNQTIKGTIAGGFANFASAQTFVGGGQFNDSEGPFAVIGGGESNLITATGSRAVIGGGFKNFAAGSRATVPGGDSCSASGDYAFAAGRRAKAVNTGSFVWADSTNADFSSTDVNQFLVRATGGVGIGTNNPSNALTVDGIVDITDRLSVGATVPDARMYVRSDLGEDAFRIRIDGSTKVVVRENGGMAIGSNSSVVPVNGLRVAGPIEANSTLTVDANAAFFGSVGIGIENTGWDLAVNGTAAKVGGGSWSVLSDERLKHSIEPLPNGVLERLLALQGMTFRYTDEALATSLAAPGQHTGFVAQQVAEVFPEWVAAGPDGYLFVSEVGTTALVVEAMRELRAEKDAEIASLHAEITSTNARLETLERLVQHLTASTTGGAR